MSLVKRRVYDVEVHFASVHGAAVDVYAPERFKLVAKDLLEAHELADQVANKSAAKATHVFVSGTVGEDVWVSTL